MDMNAERIARALGGCARGSNGWWNAKCPAHQDGRASLGLRDADDGGLAYKCMAGCDSKAVRDALKAKGLLPERQKGERKAKASWNVVATYDYTDEAGALLFQVCRMDPKDFRQRRPDPAARCTWIWRLGDVRRVLYRLPELLASAPAEPVFLVEGEKDADRLRSLGLVATTNPQGAGKWLKADRDALAGRNVVALPDNDDAGRKHARQVAADLAGKAASMRLLELPNLPPKGDVSDWLDAGGTVEELRRLAAGAPEAEPDAEPEPEPEPEPSNESDAWRWNDDLHRTDRGEARDIIHNVAIILRKDDRFAGRLRWNAMLEAVEAIGLPWRRTGDWAPWTDADDLFLTDWCQKRHVYVRRPTCVWSRSS
jgi:hypothetical protein